MNSRRGSTRSPHELLERIAGGFGVLDGHAQQGTVLGVHGRYPELFGVHFTEALVALDIEPLPCFLKRQGVQVENVRRRVLLLLVAKHEAEAAALLPDGVEGFP